MLSLTLWRGWLHACIRNIQTRHRHPPFPRPIGAIAVLSSAPLRSRSRGRRIIASSLAHIQSSASDPTMRARNGKGVGVEPRPASRTCARSSSWMLKGECMHPEEGALLFSGLLLPSRYRPWRWRAESGGGGGGEGEEIGVIALLLVVCVSRIVAAASTDRTCTHVAL